MPTVVTESPSRVPLAPQKDSPILRPANSVRNRSIVSITSSLLRSLYVSGSQVSTFNDLLYLLNRCILLAIFFFLAIYKNMQYVYRRVFLRLLALAYYPSRTPELIRDDVSKLVKIPKRISCILNLKEDEDENGGVEGLVGDISELAAWSLSAGIPTLIIYENTGILTENLPLISRAILKNLALYFGSDLIPSYSITIPHKNVKTFSKNGQNALESTSPVDLKISLLSREDGKPTIVELTKTMSELAINMELSVNDITTELIDEELTALVGPEPDLLVSYGPSLDLQDYPPWHIRLSEIYWEPDNMYVNYAVFLRSLQKYSYCKVNLGK